MRKIIGVLSDTERVLVGLDILRKLIFKYFISKKYTNFGFYVYPNSIKVMVIESHIEQLMIDKQKLLERVTQATPDIIYLYDPRQQRHIYINRELENLLGYSTKEIEKAGAGLLLRSIHPDDLPKVTDHIQTLASTRSDSFFELEYRIKGKDGSYLWFFVRENVYLRNTDNQPEILFGICQDITERKLAESLLLESQKFNHLVLESSMDAILGTAPDGSIFSANPAACKMFQRSEKEICQVGRNGLVDINDPRLNVYLEKRERTGKARGEITMIRKDGSRFPAEISSSVFTDHTGKIRTSMVIHDFTEQKLAENKLRSSKEQFSNAFHKSPAARTIARISDGKFIEVNESFLSIFEFNREEVVGHTSTELKLWSPAERKKLISMQLESGGLRNFELEGKSKSGKIVNILFSSRPMELEGEFCHLTTMIDITGQKKANEALKKSRALLEESLEKIRIITKNTPDIILVQDKDLRITLFINPPLGFKESDVIGKTDYDLISKPEADKLTLIKTRVIETGKSEYMETTLIDRDGELQYLEGTYVPNIDDKGNVQGLIGYFRNVTERKLAEEEIRKSREQIEQLYRHVNEVREEERTNISRKIHDELGQSLAGLKIDLFNMKENLDDNLQEKLNRAISLLDKTIKSVRKISSDLRPEMLDDLGLAPAIEWQTNEFKNRTGIKCKLELEEIEELNADVLISLFRIFQAALTNIMLHSKAKSVSIKMSLKEEMLILAVIDDGRGITPAQINSPKSFGIMGMRERTNQINGKFEIHSGKNKGTEIIVSVPLKK